MGDGITTARETTGPTGEGRWAERANVPSRVLVATNSCGSIRLVAHCGDGLAAGDDLVEAARAAVADALVPLNGVTPDIVTVFVSGEDDPDICAAALLAAHEAAGARTSFGCSALGVIGAGQAVSVGPAVSAWAAVLPGARVRSFHLEVLRTKDAWAVVGMPVPRDEDVVGILLTDPWSFPVEGFVGAAGGPTASLELMGGLAHGEQGAGSTRLMVDGVVHDRGAVGAVLSGVDARPHVSAGHRPFGPPMTVTGAFGSIVAELAGVPAADQLQKAMDALSPADRALADRGVMLGIAIDEYVDDHGVDEIVVRTILDVDDVRGSLETPDPVPVGTTVRFCFADPYAASDAFTDGLLGLRGADGAGGVDGVLVMACADRYSSDQGVLRDDVRSLRRVLGARGVAGMLTDGEIGPSGKGNQLHGMSSTLLTVTASDVVELPDTRSASHSV